MHIIKMIKLTSCLYYLLFVLTKSVKSDSDDKFKDFQITHFDDALENHNMKIIDLITDRIKYRQFFYAIEVSPKPNFTLDYNVFDGTRTKPLFTSITWHTGRDFGHNVSELDQVTSYRMFDRINRKHPALLHLTCFSLDELNLDTILAHNVTNILAIRGDSYHPSQVYQYAVDLVTAIRNKTQSNTSIGVGAYPEKHSDADTFETDLLRLKQKVDAGADFIITQICFSATKIINFIDAAHALNITVPIIPGIMVPRSYKQLQIVAAWLPIEIPSEMLTRLEPFQKDDDIEFQRVMNQLIVELIRELKQHTEESPDFRIPGVQFFTFNRLGNVLEVIDGVGF